MTTKTLEPLAPPPVEVTSVEALTSAYVPIAICRCGHEQDSHEHYRAGADCSVCGPVRCRRYVQRTGRGARRARPVRRSLHHH